MKQPDQWKENLKLLDLSPKASWQEVQARYRQLVLRYHPDVNPSKQSSERFRQIASAYEALVTLRREQRARSVKELARFDEDPRVRRLSIEELEMRLLYSTSPKLRAAAAYLLGKREGKESRRVLRKAVRDPDTLVRRAVVQALGEIGKPGDLYPFVAVLLDRNPGDVKKFLGSATRIWLRTLKGIFLWNLSPRRQEKRIKSFAWEEQT